MIGTPVVTTPTPVTLDDVDLEGSPLAGIPLAGIALGGLPLAGIPLAGIGSTPAENLAAWCAFINTQPGFSCTDPNSLTGQTMIGIALQGVPLAGIPLAGIPLAGIDLTGSPLAGIPLAGIDLEGSPLAGIPLAGIDFASSPLAGIPLAGISPAARDEILTCSAGDPACADSSTLGQAHAAGAVDPSATVGDIGYYCTPGSPANADCLVGHTPILLEDFVLNGLPPDVTLEDLLASLLAEAAYDWEALPLPGFPIQDFSDDGGINDYDVEFTLSGDEGRIGARVGRGQDPGRRTLRPGLEQPAVGGAFAPGSDAEQGQRAGVAAHGHPAEPGRHPALPGAARARASNRERDRRGHQPGPGQGRSMPRPRCPRAPGSSRRSAAPSSAKARLRSRRTRCTSATPRTATTATSSGSPSPSRARR